MKQNDEEPKGSNDARGDRPDVHDPLADPVQIPRIDSEKLALIQDKERLEVQLHRALADLANIRKRHLREMDEVRMRAMEGLAAELLPILDNFSRALQAHEQRQTGRAKSETDALVDGLRMVRSLLEGVLERHGIAEIQAAGTAFDPTQHEAVGIDTASTGEPGRVSQVLQKGYRIGERVIRPAKVLVTGSVDEQRGSHGGPGQGTAPRSGEEPRGDRFSADR